jgi:hypothetical protein
VTDAEVVTLCVAQAIMGIPSDPRFLAVANKRLGHLFPSLSKRPGDGTPRALALTSPKIGERDARGGAARAREPQRPSRRDQRQRLRRRPVRSHRRRAGHHDRQTPPQRRARQRPHLAPLRQRIESIYWTAKDILTLERHGARTLHALRTRLACRFFALTAAIALNHRVGLPSRALAQYPA